MQNILLVGIAWTDREHVVCEDSVRATHRICTGRQAASATRFPTSITIQPYEFGSKLDFYDTPIRNQML